MRLLQSLVAAPVPSAPVWTIVAGGRREDRPAALDVAASPPTM